MDKTELDSKIEQAAKTIRSYCMARTSNDLEAEDLAQDIILEVYASVCTLRDDRAFYGFMWSVARNVYKQWCRKKRRRMPLEGCYRLDTSEIEVDNDDIYLLRRELSLLSKRYREAVVLYYVHRQSCAEISTALSISESMVKYLLFKSREIVKEGIGMERHFGKQSYHPRELEFQFWGSGSNRYERLGGNRIAKNILFACYYDKLTAEQISLEIGVALPYMENELEMLCEYGLLKNEGKRYQTCIAVLTRELRDEIVSKTKMHNERIADMIVHAIEENEGRVRANGFGGSDMCFGVYAWQMSCVLLYQAVVGHIQKAYQLTCPRDSFGNPCFAWAVEREKEDPFALGMSNIKNKRGDSIWFHDFVIHGKMAHHDFAGAQYPADILLDVARKNTICFSEYDWATVGEMIQNGYVRSNGESVEVNMPVYTQKQYDALLQILDKPICDIAQEGGRLKRVVEEVLWNHLPAHLRKMEKDMAQLCLFEEVISATVRCLVQRRALVPVVRGEMLPTTYIVLKDE